MKSARGTKKSSMTKRDIVVDNYRFRKDGETAQAAVRLEFETRVCKSVLGLDRDLAQ
jgi:hypothetical protein